MEIAYPVRIDASNEKNNGASKPGTTQFLVGADHKLILSTGDASNEEMTQIVDTMNGKDAANRFVFELLSSVETLTSIADEHGGRTLADILYLQNAILNNTSIPAYPDSNVVEIVKSMPSAERWLTFVKMAPNSLDRQQKGMSLGA